VADLLSLAMFGACRVAILLACANAQAPSNGQPGCRCLGKIDSKVPRVDCSEHQPPFAKHTDPPYECVEVDAAYGDIDFWRLYPSSYGSSCTPHAEPANSACYNASQSQPVPQKLNPATDWCNDPWCYVDPCACDAPDVSNSQVFVDQMKYSYAACGAVDQWTGANSKDHMGGATCEIMSGVTMLRPLYMGLPALLFGELLGMFML